LNQRYRQEFDRAERLQAELADIHASRAWRVFAWLRRVRQAVRVSGWFPRSVAKPIPSRILECQPFPSHGRVSIIIPFRDQPDLLRRCLRSLRGSLYRKFEVILVDNGSTDPAMHRLLGTLQGRRRVSVVRLEEPFNFARLCNAGARHARGDHLLFLNNDIEMLTPDWLDQMLLVLQQKGVGVVGATLLYPDGSIQHAGLTEQNGVWSHVHRGERPETLEEFRGVRTVPAVSGACLLIRRQLFHELGGLDERFPVTQNDVDLCRRVWQRGLMVAITPHAQLLHYESLSRGYQREQPA
jgi:GT2 family glycosyltransferase